MKINISDIINNIPEGLEGIERVRYVYLKLGELFSYNRDYLNVEMDRRAKEDMYFDKLTILRIDNGDYYNKIEVVCKQVVEVFNEAINKIPKIEDEQISSKVVGYNPSYRNHLGIVLTQGEKNYYLDPYYDLYRIQKGMRTKYFMPYESIIEKISENKPDLQEDIKRIEFSSMSQEELEKIDNKIGYSYNSFYIDDAINKLKEEMQDKENWEKYFELVR